MGQWGQVYVYVYVNVTAYDADVCVPPSLSSTVGVVSRRYQGSYFLGMDDCILIVTWCWHGVYLYMYQSRYSRSIHIVVFHFFLAVQVTFLHCNNTMPLLLWIRATSIGVIATLQFNQASICCRCWCRRDWCFSSCCLMPSKHKCVAKFYCVNGWNAISATYCNLSTSGLIKCHYAK